MRGRRASPIHREPPGSARQLARELAIPEHFSFGRIHYPSAADEAATSRALTDTVDALARRYGVIVIDTPGHESYRCDWRIHWPIP